MCLLRLRGDEMKCKHCGNEETFYIKERISGTTHFYVDANGEAAEENSHIYDHLEHKQSKHYYCAECNKRNIPIKNEIDELLNQFGR